MQMFLRSIAVFLVFIFPQVAYCQAMDNTTVERTVNRERYARVHYENDFYTKTDYYYTQGMFVEIVHPGLKWFPLMRLILKPKQSEIKYGLALEHNGYTPMDFVQSEIQYGDRPFAATVMLKTFAIATDTTHKRRIGTTLSTGIIGPAAGGGEIQTAIHRKTGDDLPLGWHNQIANYPVLNYQVNLEQQVVALGSFALLTANVSARVGTLSDKVSAGGTLMAGFFNQPITPVSAQKRKIQLYGYIHPEVSLVGYDATMQGGFFSSNPYTIPSSDVKRIVYQHHAGVVVTLFNLYAEYFTSWTSSEFKGGKTHGTGGVQIGCYF